jgi:hypothetical protein
LASERLKNDENFVLEAIKSHGYAFKFASERLKNDQLFLLKAL